MRRRLAAVLVGALGCAPVSAQAQDWAQDWAQTYAAMQAQLVEVGTWDFSATRRGADGATECAERWTFNADGTGLIVSGEQRVSIRWYASRYEGVGQFLYMPAEASTAGPDCMGRDIDTSAYPTTSIGHQVLFYGDGTGALICFEGREIVREDGSRANLLEPEDCWGRIVPAAQD